MRIYLDDITRNKKIDKNIRKLLKLFLGMFLFIILTGCSKEPIKVGFIGEMSSGNSQLAIDARNGSEYCINEANESGGIDGRELILISKDHGGDEDSALKLHQEFIDEDIQFVIGDILSQMAPSILQSNSQDLMFVTPSISSNLISGIDDYIIRTGPISIRQGELFYKYATSNQVDQLVIVYDEMNSNYTQPVAKTIEESYADSHLTINGIVSYNSKTADLNEVITNIKNYEPKNIFFLSAANDSAYMIQKIKNEQKDINMFSVSWSMTSDFIQNGGKAVEGTTFVGIYYPENKNSAYESFLTGFEEYYGYEPTFVSIMAYDATHVLIEGIRKADSLDVEDVKESIIEISNFSGLHEDFSMDEFGDNNKQYMMYQLVDDQFIPLREW